MPVASGAQQLLSDGEFLKIFQIATLLKTRSESFLRGQDGQTIAEYGLLIVSIALTVFFASPSITTAAVKVFSKSSSVLETAT